MRNDMANHELRTTNHDTKTHRDSTRGSWFVIRGSSLMHRIRAFLRITYFALGSIYFMARYVIKAFFVGNDLDRILNIRRRWFYLIHKGLGVKIEKMGALPKEAGLLVCNHRSYYDPLVVLSELLALPVGKIEMANWPIIGPGAKMSGVIFVDRKTKEGRQKAREDILKGIQNGYFVINYPEGTTHTNPQTTDFKPALFKDAAAAGFPIYPVVHEYQSDGDAWVGDDTFLNHFFNCFGKKVTRVRLSYGPKIEGDNPEELMQKAKQWIDEELLRLREGWHETSPQAHLL